MALYALQCAVPTSQREVRRCMTKRCRLPRTLRVTLQAIVTELTLLMVRVRRVVEPRCMTIKACVRQLILIIHMTLIARYRLMRTCQRERCAGVTEC